ncbi:MAG: DUF1573 domain-containing protein [Chitinophagaceae bacterium]|uniref:DUF1573 domain-containing protein n=1 Tax=unclassified Paraflavitalea TaxID=2798305 RepID=UPI003D33AD2B|nr:DUF1573 domain-containing protein [Chitinophagaceae bacterium]
MKARTFILASVISLVGVSCLNTTDKEKKGYEPVVMPDNTVKRDTANFTKIEWIDSSRSMGEIENGQVLKINYKFKNSGNKPLIIEKVQPGCGCTVADYPKEPIAPGASGEITAEFDSKGKEGIQKKNITVYANTMVNIYTLWFDVKVKKAAN